MDGEREAAVGGSGRSSVLALFFLREVGRFLPVLARSGNHPRGLASVAISPPATPRIPKPGPTTRYPVSAAYQLRPADCRHSSAVSKTRPQSGNTVQQSQKCVRRVQTRLSGVPTRPSRLKNASAECQHSSAVSKMRLPSADTAQQFAKTRPRSVDTAPQLHERVRASSEVTKKGHFPTWTR